MTESAEVPAYDVLVDERGRVCPMPVISLARTISSRDWPLRVLLLSDDPASRTDVPAWCALRDCELAWTGAAPDGRGTGYLVVTREAAP